MTKHGELVSAQLDDYAIFNNFVVDPQHLSPTNTTPAAVDDKLPVAPAVAAGMGMGMGIPAFNPANLPGGAGGEGGMQQQQQQMMMMMMQMQQAMMMQMQGQAGMGNGAGAGAGVGGGGRGGSGAGAKLQDRMGGYVNDNMGGGGKYNGSYSNNNGAGAQGNGAGQPRGAMGTQIGTPGKEDPRAKRGRVSYQDLDEVGGGEGGGLPY